MDMKKIKSPADIKKLTLAELNTLCGELRAAAGKIRAIVAEAEKTVTL